MPGSTSNFTSLLKQAREREDNALDALFPLVYEELRHLAHKVHSGHVSETLNTTALVHEAYLKLVDTDDWESRLHFFRTAARAMRQILVDVARRRLAQKRGGDMPAVTFNEEVHSHPIQAAKLVELDEALNALQDVDARAAQVVECRFFAGLSIEETAAALAMSPRTVKRDWRTARAFLADALKTSEA